MRTSKQKLESAYQRSKRNSAKFTKSRADIIEQIIKSSVPNMNLKVTITKNGL